MEWNSKLHSSTHIIPVSVTDLGGRHSWSYDMRLQPFNINYYTWHRQKQFLVSMFKVLHSKLSFKLPVKYFFVVHWEGNDMTALIVTCISDSFSTKRKTPYIRPEPSLSWKTSISATVCPSTGSKRTGRVV